MAKNEQFVKLTNDMLNVILESGSTNIENLKINGKSFEEASQELTAIIGEKIGFRRTEILKATDNQTIGIYTHMNNRVATAILVDGKVSDEVVTNIAMHIAAMNPKYVNESEVDQN